MRLVIGGNRFSSGEKPGRRLGATSYALRGGVFLEFERREHSLFVSSKAVNLSHSRRSHTSAMCHYAQPRLVYESRSSLGSLLDDTWIWHFLPITMTMQSHHQPWTVATCYQATRVLCRLLKVLDRTGVGARARL